MLALASSCVVESDTDVATQEVSSLDVVPHGQGGGVFNKFSGPSNEAGGGGGKSVAIAYHGGPVMTSGTNVYYIWYGNWNGMGTDENVLRTYAQGVGGSSYWAINQTYSNASSTHVSAAVTLAGEANDSGSAGLSNLSDGNILQIVENNFGTVDPNGVYFVLTGPNVTKSGMCTSYCGWHTHASYTGQDLKYAFVGAPSSCGSNAGGCEVQALGPNGTGDGDAMVSVVAHELEEAVSDPDLNAWYDRRGAENADKCAWTFGTEQTASNGAQYNLTIGGINLLIQRNWSASAQRCERIAGSPN